MRGFSARFLSLFFIFSERKRRERGKGEREEKARESVLFLPCVFWSDKAKEGDFF